MADFGSCSVSFSVVLVGVIPAALAACSTTGMTTGLSPNPADLIAAFCSSAAANSGRFRSIDFPPSR